MCTTVIESLMLLKQTSRVKGIKSSFNPLSTLFCIIAKSSMPTDLESSLPVLPNGRETRNIGRAKDPFGPLQQQSCSHDIAVIQLLYRCSFFRYLFLTITILTFISSIHGSLPHLYPTMAWLHISTPELQQSSHTTLNCQYTTLHRKHHIPFVHVPQTRSWHLPQTTKLRYDWCLGC